MANQNFGTAQAQSVLMLQKVNKMIALTQNLDGVLQKQFTTVKVDDIGLQNYRQPIQIEVGGNIGAYQPDGGNYFQGTGADYTQAIIAPVPILDAIATTELARRISKGGMDVVVEDYVAKLIKDVKKKVAHKQNIYLQTYNDGKLATVDSSYGGVSTVIPLTAGEFGGRLIDLNDQLQVFDSSKNALGTVNILEVNKNSIGGIDTVTVDAVPAGTVSTCAFYPINVASGNPLFVAGLKYLVSTAITGDYFGIDRSMPYVQSPGMNANNAFFTLGGALGFLQRMEQALGSERFSSERPRNFWYLHGANYVSAQYLGFGKQIIMSSDGKMPNFDGVPDPFAKRSIAGMPAMCDSTAAVDKVYWLDKSVLMCVRYPGSQAFIPGMTDGGLWWPRNIGGNWNSESDALYQDSCNFYSRDLWSSGVYYNLGTQPIFAN